jgi:uncharacterized protein YgbK (DUF1537 family)
MRSLAILADDLTGALDTAAPFATSLEPVRVSWRDAPLSGEPRIAFDTESRDLAGDQAATRVASALTRFGDAGLRFKKLDSLIRGNTLIETATCTASLAFRSVVIAPAFPEQDRITRCGTQIAPGRNGRATPVADLASGLRQHGVALTLVQRGGTLPRRGISLCDAETSDDLAAIARQGADLDGPVLWCGSAGLARALGSSGSGGRSIRLGAGPRLFIVGSPHPVALSQAARLRTLLGEAMVAVTGDLPPTDTVAPAVRAIAAGQSGAITFAMPTLEAARVAAIMSNTFSALARSPAPPVVVVVGGDTLFRLCRATAATSLLAIGEWAPGVPMARIAGGAWDGTSIVTKSGAFADSDVLVRLLEGPSKEECTWT